MEVTYTHEVPFGHRLMFHDGKCKFPHGHNYMISVTLAGPVNDNGMVVDFSWLKGAVRAYFEQFDHAFVLFEGDPLVRLLNGERLNGLVNPDGMFSPNIPTKVVVLNVHPTAENLAQ